MRQRQLYTMQDNLSNTDVLVCLAVGGGDLDYFVWVGWRARWNLDCFVWVGWRDGWNLDWFVWVG